LEAYLDGLYVAGIGGIEVGFHHAGYRAALLCDFDSAAQAVLAERSDIERCRARCAP
jgi:site-specific DNA-cytosine methylase